jgi:hypothetical protein
MAKDGAGIERATFCASIAPNQSGISAHGGGNGMRVILDVPESDLPEAIKLILWRMTLLRVTVEPME